MLQNAYFLAKIGADTAENEQHFAEILPISGTGRRPPGRCKPPQQAGVQQAGAPGEGDDDIYVNIQEWVPPALQNVARSW